SRAGYSFTMISTANRSLRQLRVAIKNCSGRLVLPLTCAATFLAVKNCGFADNTTATDAGKSVDSSRISSPIASAATASNPSRVGSKPATPEVPNLTGRTTEEVEATLGKPTGKLRSAQGVLWLYAEWRVQF